MSADNVWREMWRWITSLLRIRTQHTRTMENENARLREENRALVNSILGLAGIPPMRVAASAGMGLAQAGRRAGRSNEKTTVSVEANAQVAPLRRRSWQQMGREREIEDARAARRERESNTDTFPAPSNIVVRN